MRALIICVLILSPGVFAPGQADPISQGFLHPDSDHWITPEEAGLETEKVGFPNAFGATLSGWLFDHPRSDRVVLFCMGNTGNISYMLKYAQVLYQTPVDVFLFDYQGFGQSEGVIALASLPGDASAALGYLIETRSYPPEKVAVMGVSLGSILALALASQRPIGAVAVEDAYLPSEQLTSAKKHYEDNFLAKAALALLERTVIPRVDPLFTVPRIGCPIFLIHGQHDWLLAPSATIRIAKECPTRPRVWILEDAGHAPETLEVNEREYAHQLQRFFRESLDRTPVADPEVEITAVAPDGDGSRVDLRLRDTARRPVRVCLTDDAGQRFHFVDGWTGDGVAEWKTSAVPFVPSSATAVVFGSVVDRGDTWEPDLSPLSRSLAGFRVFSQQLPRRNYSVVKLGKTAYALPSYEKDDWALIRELLPSWPEVHPAIRPRYAHRLANVTLALAKEHPEQSLEAARVMKSCFPARPETYYELGNGSMTLGFQGTILAEASYAAARLELTAGKVEAAKDRLRDYLTTLPKGYEPRVTEATIAALAKDSTLP